jgi:hypothetical protein
MTKNQKSLTAILTTSLMVAGVGCLLGALCGAAFDAPKSLVVSLTVLTPVLILLSWAVLIIETARLQRSVKRAGAQAQARLQEQLARITQGGRQ